MQDSLFNSGGSVAIFISKNVVYCSVECIAYMDKGRQRDFYTIIFNVADMAGVDISHISDIFLRQILVYA